MSLLQTLRRFCVLAAFGAPATSSSCGGVSTTKDLDSQGAEAQLPPVAVSKVRSIPGSSFGEFHRVVAGLFLRADHILVASTGPFALSVFDTAGREVRLLGRQGDGPGEFRQIQRRGLWSYAGDSILLYDWRALRATVMDRNGAGIRVFQLGSVPGVNARSLELLGPLPDRTIAVLARRAFQPGVANAARLMETVYRFMPDGGVGEIIDSFPGGEQHGTRSGDVGPLMLARQSVFGVGRSGLYVGVSDSFVVHRVWPMGGPVLRFSDLRRRVTDELRERERRHVYEEESTRFRGAPAVVLEARLRYARNAGFPPILPEIDRIIVDTEDRIWVRRFVPPSLERETTSGL